MKRKSSMDSIIALMAVLLAAPGALADTWFLDDDQVLIYPDANGTS